MKRIFEKVLTILICFLFIVGCANKVEPHINKEQGKFIDVTFEGIKEKIEKQETFVLQFELTTCHFCKMLGTIEKEYFKENDIDIYVFKVDKNRNAFQNNLEFINQYFGEIKDVPSVFWVFEGEAKNNLPIVDEKEQARIFEAWINDNINYYK